MTKKIYKRCGSECFDFCPKDNESYCKHGPKLRKVSEDQRCLYHLEKPQNPEYDSQNLPMSMSLEDLAKIGQSSATAATLAQDKSLDDYTKGRPIRCG